MRFLCVLVLSGAFSCLVSQTTPTAQATPVAQTPQVAPATPTAQTTSAAQTAPAPPAAQAPQTTPAAQAPPAPQTTPAAQITPAPAAPEDPEVLRARGEADRIRVMVDTGAVPRAQLAKAEAALADAQDAATIKHTIYSQDLSEDQANELVAAASRRFDRRKAAFDEAKKLVDLGIAAQNSLQAKLEDMDFARTECQLATSRAQLSRELAAMAEAEAAMPRIPVEPLIPDAPPESRYDGNGVFTPVMLAHVETAFASKFGKPLPISANGDTAVHRALGFDHSGRVDVAIHPDQPEGQWLLQYLVANKIPYFAFRQAVAGKATGAHIHIGPGSTHIAVKVASAEGPAAPPIH